MAAIDILSHHLVPLSENKFTPVTFDDSKNYSAETVKFESADTSKHVFKMFDTPKSLYKLTFNGTFDNTFELCISLDGNTLSRYRAPYRFILMETNTIEFHVPNVYGTLELHLAGFIGIISATKHINLEKETMLFAQYSGRYKFMPLTTDLMLESAEPISSVAIDVGLYGYPHTDTILFDSTMLDDNYTKFTGKPSRPKNFAICSIKNKEKKFTIRFDLLAVRVNDTSIDKSTIHYHAYDLFIASYGHMVNRYAT